jgi:hypothetical protein
MLIPLATGIANDGCDEKALDENGVGNNAATTEHDLSSANGKHKNTGGSVGAQMSIRQCRET